MANFEVDFYETVEGRAPAEEFIDSQNMKCKQKFIARDYWQKKDTL